MSRKTHPSFYVVTVTVSIVAGGAWLAGMAYLEQYWVVPALVFSIIAILGFWLLLRNQNQERERIFKEMARLKRTLEEFHLKNEKLDFDATQATESKRMMVKDMLNKDRILMRMAKVLETNMSQQLISLEQNVSAKTEQLKTSSTRMLDYARDLEVLASLELHEVPIPEHPVPLDSLLEQQIKQHETAFSSRNNKVAIENDEEQILVYRSESLLKELVSRMLNVTNLLGRDITINIQLIAYLDADFGECIRVSMSQHGRGLSEVEQQEFFQHYSEIDFQGEDVSPGMAPVVCYQLAKKMGGKLQVNSQINELFELILILPLGGYSEEARDVYNETSQAVVY